MFNGNIAAMAVNIPQLGATKVYNYHYDQLNRIVAMDTYNGLSGSGGTFTPVNISDYQERIAYDPNGNIRTYQRNGDASRTSMDNLSYFYKPNTNQLHKVTDAAPDASTGTYSQYNDIKQGQSDNNYRYDAIGNLIGDDSSKITGINWTVYGKIKSISQSGSVINYAYDATGNRILKATAADTSVYVRDATGNVLSIYEKKPGGALAQTQVPVYGSSRLGMVTQHIAPDSALPLSGGFGNGKKSIFTRGEKLFELSNHLGNVLVTVTDRRQQFSVGGVAVDNYRADIASASDYYPFGMLMPARNFNAAGYRYGFNGKEQDPEVKGNGNQYDYGFRIYDPRIGKFLSVDPLTKKYPMLTPYQFASNSPIAAIDLDGLEGLVATGVNGTGMIVTAENAAKIDKRIVVSAFKAAFPHYIPKELIEHYAYGNGTPFNLNEQRMRDVNPLKIGVQGLIRKDQDQFNETLGKLEKGKSVQLKDWRVLDGSLTSGGLGGFTVIFDGVLTKDKNDDKKWTFSGTMKFFDNWNFNSHDQAVANGEKDYRSKDGDKVTTLARKYLPGTPFNVTSDNVNVTQTSQDEYVNWFKGYEPKSSSNIVYDHPDIMSGVKKDIKH